MSVWHILDYYRLQFSPQTIIMSFTILVNRLAANLSQQLINYGVNNSIDILCEIFEQHSKSFCRD